MPVTGGSVPPADELREWSERIAAERLEVRGYGYDQPLPGRPASAGENRRVEAVRIS